MIRIWRSYLTICLTLLLLTSDLKSQYVLNFCNNNSTTVDSVIVTKDDAISIKSISSGNCKSFDIPYEWTNKHGIVMCNYKIYFGHKYISGQRTKTTLKDTVYIEKDINLEPIVRILINNLSNYSIDSITVANSIIEKPLTITPREKSIEVKYKDLLSNPIIEISMNNAKKRVTLLKQDFANLSNPYVPLWLDDTCFLKGSPPFDRIMEFKVVFQSATPDFKLGNINLISNALVGETKTLDSSYRVFVLDLNKLREKPYFELFIGKNEYKIKLSSNDLSANYYGRKYFWVSQKGIKQQY